MLKTEQEGSERQEGCPGLGGGGTGAGFLGTSWVCGQNASLRTVEQLTACYRLFSSAR